MDDQIFSTFINLRYTYGCTTSEGRDGPHIWEQNLKNEGEDVYAWEDVKVGALAREFTLNVFAHDESASVQVRGNGDAPILPTALVAGRGLTLFQGTR
jgi:hypothetical protein